MLRNAVSAAICLCVLIFASHEPLFAASYTTVASEALINGEVRDGDIVSYNPESGTYTRSTTFGDELVYGVVVLDPVLVLTGSLDAATGTPVVRYGEARVNVSTAGGYIEAGDLITTSPIAGHGQRVLREEGTYILGFAIDDMVLSGETATVNGEEVALGSVSIALRIGPYLSKEGVTFIASSSVIGLSGAQTSNNENSFDTFKMFRYILAAIVAIAAVMIAARRFGDTFSQSVISIGRNPLARSHIRSMVLWNSFLIILISCVGFGISAAIILVP